MYMLCYIDFVFLFLQKEYKKAYEKNKALGFTPLAFTADMQRYKYLRNFTNWVKCLHWLFIPKKVVDHVMRF